MKSKLKRLNYTDIPSKTIKLRIGNDFSRMNDLEMEKEGSKDFIKIFKIQAKISPYINSKNY